MAKKRGKRNGGAKEAEQASQAAENSAIVFARTMAEEAIAKSRTGHRAEVAALKRDITDLTRLLYRARMDEADARPQMAWAPVNEKIGQ